MDDFHWTERGACAPGTGTDPEMFFSDSREQQQRAKALCRTCPVKELCLKAALSRPEDFGVWGGTTPRERRTIQLNITRARAA